MINIRKSEERGHMNHGWLDTYHSFSFAEYYDPKYMGFRSLRVINDDRVSGGAGFDTHPHKNMEILTYVLEGELAHKDSLGTGSTIKAGEVQLMSAGRGIFHSEFNPSATNEVHLLQIWIMPESTGLQPTYQQKDFKLDTANNQLVLIASPNAHGESLKINQDARIYSARLTDKAEVTHVLETGRAAWLQVAKGEIILNGVRLQRGDGATITDENRLTISSNGNSEILLFDLI